MAGAVSAYEGFRRSRWLPAGHLETIAAVFNKKPHVRYQREILPTCEQDEIALDYAIGSPQKPLLVMFHGLEGCSQSRTLRLLARGFIDSGWTVAVPHFRGCGGHRNHLPRAYHAGDAAEVEWMISRCQKRFSHRNSFVIGVSLGGSALIHHLAQGGQSVAAATVSTPFNLPACVEKLDCGLNRRIYANFFLNSLRPKIIEKSCRFPDICDVEKIKTVRTIGEFDELYTAPVHGFKNAVDYWQRASTATLLDKVTSPLLCINALNDPLIPPQTLPPPPRNPLVKFMRPQHGGHGAFIGKPRDWLFQAVYNFFNLAMTSSPQGGRA